jgi:uncharacterized membrane protein
MEDSAAVCPACGRAVPAAAQPTTASAGALADNVAGALAYLLLPAIIFLLLEPYSRKRFVRFHSLQAIVFFIATVVINYVAGLLPVISLFLLPLLGLAELILWIVLMVQAFQNKWFKLPVLGDLAERQAGP